MSNRGDRRKIFFPHEGYLLLCDEGGVEIHVTEYHAGTLRLSWETLTRWSSEATAAQRALPLDFPAEVRRGAR